MKEQIKADKRYSNILLFSVVASLCFHFLAIFSLNKYLLAYSPMNKFFKVAISDKKSSFLSKRKKEEIYIFSMANCPLIDKMADTKAKSTSLVNVAIFPLPEMVEKAWKGDGKATKIIDEKALPNLAYIFPIYDKKENFLKQEFSKIDFSSDLKMKRDNSDHIISCLKAKATSVSNKVEAKNLPTLVQKAVLPDKSQAKDFSKTVFVNPSSKPVVEELDLSIKTLQNPTKDLEDNLNLNSIYVFPGEVKKEPYIKPEISKIDSGLKIQKKDNEVFIIGELKANLAKVASKKASPKVAYTIYSNFSTEKTNEKEPVISGIRSQEERFSLPFNVFEVNNAEHKKVVADYLRNAHLRRMQDKSLESESLSKKAPFLPFIPHIPSLSDLNTISCGNDFEIDLEYVEREDDQGYIFALTLIPKVERQFERINQNFYFLLDKSNSIQNTRYTSSRQALVSALNSLNKKDTFNICAFDSKMEMLYSKNKNPTHEYISTAKNFLLAKKIAPFFSSKSLALPFKEMLDNRLDKDEINNIVLISNGEDFDKQKNFLLVNQWTELNKNQQSLYILALESDKNLPILEIFAKKNNGQLVIAHSEKSIRRNLVRLVKSLNYPVAKNILVSVYEKDEPDVTFFSQKNKQTHLYYDQPYVLLGTTKSLDDFVIFIQGKNPDTYFNIKKKISFENAKRGEKSLLEKWAQYRANLCYEKYMKDGDVKNLKLAEEILSPYDLTPAFKK